MLHLAMINRPDYHPIDCGFYDILEATAVRKTRCEFVFKDERGDLRSVTTRLLHLFSEDEEEFAVLESGEIIRLDHLLSVRGILRPVS